MNTGRELSAREKTLSELLSCPFIIVTPALTGTLLPGITRDSILQLARDLGYGAEERRVSVEEWRKGNADGTILTWNAALEVWRCAWVCSPGCNSCT